jgi:hypothetical protein
MRRRRFSTIDISVDASDVLDQLDTEDLVEEVKKRRRHMPLDGLVGSDWLDRMRWFLLRGDASSALAMVEAELWPCRNAEAKAVAELGLRGTVQ